MTPIAQLKELSEQYDLLTDELIRHHGMADKLRAEEEQLADSADLDDKTAFEALSKVRLKRELVPAKIEQIERRLGILDAELKECVERARQEVNRKSNAQFKALVARVERALAPFDLVADQRASLVESVATYSKSGIVLRTVGTDGVWALPPRDAARKVLEIFAALAE